jgi:quinoprotein glucose dehydrogenase
MVWYYQVVHHDLWDYDIAAQPMLIDIPMNGKIIPAVAVGTKMGLIFTLHRETGKPIFPIVEKPVPASAIPGEEASKTQPIPIRPEPLGLHSASVADAWGIDQAGKEDAEKRISKYTNKGIYTPPSFEGTLVTPSNVGGINWGGMCYDAKQHLLITPVNRLAAVIRLIPRENLAQIEKEQAAELNRAETGRQAGTPYVMKRDYLLTIKNGQVVMQTKPPWGTLVAIDMKTGSKKWEVPLGYMLDPKTHPDAAKWGSLNMGGAIVTAGNLAFIAASRDDHLRAFNTATGKLLWEYLLPASAQATPMTYEVNGKQYIVIAAGGHGKFSTKQGDFVVAFALP